MPPRSRDAQRRTASFEARESAHLRMTVPLPRAGGGKLDIKLGAARDMIEG
jgi:hypothetical protein